jgi:hypothetical protein
MGLFTMDGDRLTRSGAHYAGTWGFVLDDVGTEKVPVVPTLEPTFKIATSPGNEQWGYVLDYPVEDWDEAGFIVGGLVAAKMTDPFITSGIHLFRFPGTRPHGKEHAAALAGWSGRVYTKQEFIEGLGITPQAHPGGHRTRAGGTMGSDPGTAAHDPVWQWLRDNGHTATGTLDHNGWADVRCPTSDRHSDPDRPWGRYHPRSALGPEAFMCFHGSCQGKDDGHKTNTRDLWAWVEERGGPTDTDRLMFDQACQQAFSEAYTRAMQGKLPPPSVAPVSIDPPPPDPVENLQEKAERKPDPKPEPEPEPQSSKIKDDVVNMWSGDGGASWMFTDDSRNPKAYSSAQALLGMKFANLTPVVSGWLFEGSTNMFFAKQKAGKSHMALDLLEAVAGGTQFLGRGTTRGKTMYYAMEDGARRVATRLGQRDIAEPTRRNMEVYTPERMEREGCGPAWSQRMAHLVTAIDTHRPRLVVIDTRTMFEGAIDNPNLKDLNAYQRDVELMKAYKKIASAYGVAIVITTHTKKSTVGNSGWGDQITGSSGQLATVDTYWTIHRKDGSSVATLIINGRDLEGEEQISIQQGEGGRWYLLDVGAAVTQALAHSRDVKGQPSIPSRILTILMEAGTPMPRADLEAALGADVKANSIKVALRDLLKKGAVTLSPEGYATPPREG